MLARIGTRTAGRLLDAMQQLNFATACSFRRYPVDIQGAGVTRVTMRHDSRYRTSVFSQEKARVKAKNTSIRFTSYPIVCSRCSKPSSLGFNFLLPRRISSPQTKEASRLGEESFSLIASNCLLGQFERERGLIEEAVGYRFSSGQLLFFNKAWFPRGWWQMERIPLFASRSLLACHFGCDLFVHSIFLGLFVQNLLIGRSLFTSCSRSGLFGFL
ncbi:hypothetical protein HDV64DRAFT_166160 [Trichoderma sp. TUCIM 5745]